MAKRVKRFFGKWAVFTLTLVYIFQQILTIPPTAYAVGQSPTGQTEWLTVAAGNLHAVAIRNDGLNSNSGSLWAWGANDQGQIGDGTTRPRVSPTLITTEGTINEWVYAAAGGNHTVAINAYGELWQWGNSLSNKPVKVGSGLYKAVAAGANHTLAIDVSGNLWAWGDNISGQLGLGPSDLVKKYFAEPQLVDNSGAWKSVAAGKNHSLAIKNDGSLFSWGDNSTGQLGRATGEFTKPERVGIATWKTVAAGSNHTLAINTDGTLWAWGDNTKGQLGNGTYASAGTPTILSSVSEKGWIAVSAGEYHTLALNSAGEIWAWGDNSNGQLGDGTTVSKPYRVQIGQQFDWLSVNSLNKNTIAGGSNFSLAIKVDRTVWSWGDNFYGQLGDGTRNDASSPVAVLEDRISPQVLSTDPESEKSGVSVAKPLKITFSEDIKEGDKLAQVVIKDVYNTTVNYTYKFENDILYLIPNEYLVFNAVYNVTIPAGAVKDVNGNPLTREFNFNFITSEPLNILKSEPANNATGVNLNGTLKVFFEEYIQKGFETEFNNIKLWNVASNVYEDNIAAITGSILSIIPVNELQDSISYEVYIPAKAVVDLDGNPMADIYSFTFSTRNLIPRWNYPVLVFSDITESNVTLSWDGASKNTASYQILMDGNLLNANVVDKTYNVSGLSAGTDYKFKIKAGNAAGWSNDGPEEIVTTADNGLPIWPERVLNFVYNALEVKKATVRWPDTAYDNVGVMGYYVYLDGNLVGTVAGNVYSYEVNSLSPNNTYNFWVEAFDRAGKRSNPSPTGTLTSHPDWNAPYWNNTVLNVIYPDDYSVELSWDPATDYDQVANYRIIQNGQEIATVGNQTYKYKITNLAPGQYTFNIDAVDLSGNRRSDDNPTKTIIIADKTPPVWQNAYVTARVNSDTELTLNWSVASDIGVVNYRVYQSNGTVENLIATVGGSTYDVSGLTPGQRYNFWIEAGDAAGNWTSNGPTTSLIVQTADHNPPVWPINPLTVYGQTYTAGTVSWPEAQDDSGVVLGYWVYADNYLVSNVVASVYSYTYNYFLPGLIYEFKVTAVDQAGNSTSAYAYATTLQDNVYPEWQVGSYVYQSNLTQTGVTLTWGTALDNSGVITYRVYGNNQYYNATVSQSNNGLTITGLSAGTEYTFSIEAVDASGNSRR